MNNSDSKKVVTDSKYYSQLADLIREYSNSKKTYTPAEMIEALKGIGWIKKVDVEDTLVLSTHGKIKTTLIDNLIFKVFSDEVFHFSDSLNPISTVGNLSMNLTDSSLKLTLDTLLYEIPETQEFDGNSHIELSELNLLSERYYNKDWTIKFRIKEIKNETLQTLGFISKKSNTISENNKAILVKFSSSNEVQLWFGNDLMYSEILSATTTYDFKLQKIDNAIFFLGINGTILCHFNFEELKTPSDDYCICIGGIEENDCFSGSLDYLSIVIDDENIH